MAKKKSKSNKKTYNRRVTPANASRRLPSYTLPPRSISLLRLTEDRRNWNPEGVTSPARSFSAPRHRLTLPKKPIKNAYKKFSPPIFSHPSTIAFKNPDSVLVCVRRRIRKEVLHAKRQTGKTGQRSPRMSDYSSISCRK